MTNLATRRGRAVDEVLAARDYVRALPYTTSSVGVAGFCMGGGFVMITATKGFDAAAPFYGAMPGSYGDHFEGSCPIVASLATRDPFVFRGEPRLRKALDTHDIEHDIKTYEAGHSFANQLPMQPLMRIAGFGYSPRPRHTHGAGSTRSSPSIFATTTFSRRPNDHRHDTG